MASEEAVKSKPDVEEQLAAVSFHFSPARNDRARPRRMAAIHILEEADRHGVSIGKSVGPIYTQRQWKVIKDGC